MSYETEQIGHCTLFRGDAREVLPTLKRLYDVVITDPVWPQCEHVFPGIDATALCGQVLQECTAQRVVLHLGINSDPRFLQCVPARWPFLRICYLEYAVVGHVGRLLRDAEVAYAFGLPPPSQPGQRVLPGRVIATRPNKDKGWKYLCQATPEKIAALPHPSRRNLDHVAWLVKWFAAGTILDPFMGTGTTGVAALRQGKPFIGIELDPRYFAMACAQIEQAYAQGDLFMSRPAPQAQQAHFFR